MGMIIMVGGDGVTSYSKNSRLQEKAILRAKPIVEEAIKEVYNSLQPESLVAADLGCSSGPNALLVISEIVEAIAVHCREFGHKQPEIQYFLNDLPGNDFNTIFDYSERFKEKLRDAKGEEIVPYVVGVPGSFYGRLFPRRTVHFFHSSYSLQWLSRVPQGLESDTGVPLNKGNIYIGKSSPQIVVESYLKQYQKDFSTFLRLRFEELVPGGRMVFIFLGRTSSQTPYGELSSFYGLLADALNAMVLEGLLNEAKVDAFNLPIYAPSMEEVMTIVQTTRLFHVEQVDIFKTNWDPFDDSSDDDSVSDNFESGKNVANCIRAVVEPMLEKYFGEAIMDELFSRYEKNVARHLSGEKGKHVVFVLVLRK